MKRKVLVTREVFDETISHLAQHFDVTSNQANVDYSRDQMVARLQGMDGALVTTTDRIDEDLLARCPVSSVQRQRRPQPYRPDACTPGVVATNTPVLTDSVARTAICLTATVRRLTEERMVRASGGAHTQAAARLICIMPGGRAAWAASDRRRQRLRGFESSPVYRSGARG